MELIPLFVSMTLPVISAAVVQLLVTDKSVLYDCPILFDCPPHTYSYMLTKDGEHLQCIDCNFIPGTY